MARVIGLGIDAGSIAFIDELVAAGSLPNLRAVRERSLRVPLDGAPSYRYGVLWPQFVAGAEARLGGEWLRFSFDPSTYEGYQSGARHSIDGHLPFWEPAEARVVTLDVPGTTVLGPGVHVTAWGADAALYPRASQPRGLLREFDGRFGVHPGYETYDCGWHDPKRLDRFTDACVTGAGRRADIAIELMTRYPDWELFLAVMSESHMASEIMWHALEPDHPLADFDSGARARLERVFSAIDDAVGRVIAQAPDDATVVIFSLDGMRSSPGDVPSIALFPELMHRHQFGTSKLRDHDDVEAWRRAGCPPLVPRRGRAWRRDLNERLVDPPHQPWRHHVPGYEAMRLSAPGRRLLKQLKGMEIGVLGVPVPPESTADPETLDAGRDSADGFLFIGNYREHRSAMRAFALPDFRRRIRTHQPGGARAARDRPGRRVRERVSRGGVTHRSLSRRANRPTRRRSHRSSRKRRPARYERRSLRRSDRRVERADGRDRTPGARRGWTGAVQSHRSALRPRIRVGEQGGTHPWRPPRAFGARPSAHNRAAARRRRAAPSIRRADSRARRGPRLALTTSTLSRSTPRQPRRSP